ncbi:MAG: alpha/beta fold hydrolase, partial [Halanaerobiales bacterium]
MSKFNKYSFEAQDGLSIYASSFEVDNPKGIVLGLHGMAEHRKRYEEFAKKLNIAGYSFYIHDHRGHGDTALKNNLPLGHFADKNGWNKVLDDVKKHREYILNKNDENSNKEIPIFLFGHSMGSFVARNYIMIEPEDFKGAIFSGTGHVKGSELFFLKLFISLEKFLRGANEKSKIVENLIFNSNNKEFEPTKTPHDWLTRDEEVVQKYYNDERCGFSCTVQFYEDFYKGMLALNNIDNYKVIANDFPMIFLSGENDPVGGEDIVEVVNDYKSAALKNVEYKLYEN